MNNITETLLGLTFIFTGFLFLRSFISKLEIIFKEFYNAIELLKRVDSIDITSERWSKENLKKDIKNFLYLNKNVKNIFSEDKK